MNVFGNVYSDASVLLTGHTGFKGSWMAQWLLRCGARLTGYALDPQPHETLYRDLGLEDRLAADHRGNLSDLERLTALVSSVKPRFVFHFAAQPLVRLSYDIPVETFATNVMGTVHLLEAVRRSGHACTVVVITTDKCYENREWLHSYREEDPMGGHDPYSASKGAAEIAVASYRRSFFDPGGKVAVATARAGNVIGGGDWAIDRIVPDCIRALRAGESIPVRNRVATRPWQHVLEPLSGYLWLGAVLDDPGLAAYPSNTQFRSAFNFGPRLTSNRPVSSLVEELLRHTGGHWIDCSDPAAPHEASKLNLAIDKTHHLLQWQPVWDFPETIARTAEWYLAEQRGEVPSILCDKQIESYQTAAAEAGLCWAV
ncbi:CDP-glucose 4,6-dehydratase [Luteolibacter sp. LG18]|uniref:CDP-glucose 4,6-dehydratase n=1 Tax=Luteolibacter sp. LG18 TaxID=2819286 RepID=UPI002B2CE67E|nr:CDP-glucose 4,6-dehydratase [Luteolibacter sp. LG18]